MAHPDNTFKALKGEAMFVDRWQCRWGLHRWTKWSDGKKDSSSLYYKQHRTCVDCGRQELQKLLGHAKDY